MTRSEHSIKDLNIVWSFFKAYRPQAFVVLTLMVISGLLKSVNLALMIAHRLSTVQNASKIIVLENGRVVEEGLHDEFLKTQKNYYQLFIASQS